MPHEAVVGPRLIVRKNDHDIRRTILGLHRAIAARQTSETKLKSARPVRTIAMAITVLASDYWRE